MIERVSFGNRLRHARERRRLSLDQIADETKLSASIITALEDGSCARWPVGVYSRSYVRTYAELVGLDAAATVDEFAALFPELAYVDAERSARPGEPTVPARRTPRAPSGPLRLLLEEPPASWWQQLLTRLSWWLHRLANGGPGPAHEGASADWPATTREDATSFRTLL